MGEIPGALPGAADRRREAGTPDGTPEIAGEIAMEPEEFEKRVNAVLSSLYGELHDFVVSASAKHGAGPMLKPLR